MHADVCTPSTFVGRWQWPPLLRESSSDRGDELGRVPIRPLEDGGERRRAERERGQWTGQTADARSHGSRINKRTQEELRWAGNSGFGRFPRCPVAEIFV